jgi:hypothetical protein
VKTATVSFRCGLVFATYVNKGHRLLLLTVFDVWISLPYGDDVSQSGAEPLRVDKVEITQLAVGVVNKDPVAVQEAGGLV